MKSQKVKDTSFEKQEVKGILVLEHKMMMMMVVVIIIKQHNEKKSDLVTVITGVEAILC